MERIRVLHNWGGEPSAFRRVEAGEYDINDPRLFGLAEYLVTNGHAVAIEAEPPDDTAPLEPKPRKRKG